MPLDAALADLLAANFPGLALPAHVAARLPALVPRRRLADGRSLFVQGHKPTAFYAVAAGEIETRFTGADGSDLGTFPAAPSDPGVWEFDIAPGAGWPAGPVSVTMIVHGRDAEGTGTLFLPATGGQGAAPGGTMSCVAESLPNHPVALAASLGLRGPTAVPFGIAWVDPATFVVLRIGITDGSGRMTTTIAIPPGIPRGLPLTVQTAAGSPTNQTLVLGVPAVLHVL